MSKKTFVCVYVYVNIYYRTGVTKLRWGRRGLMWKEDGEPNRKNQKDYKVCTTFNVYTATIYVLYLNLYNTHLKKTKKYKINDFSIQLKKQKSNNKMIQRKLEGRNKSMKVEAESDTTERKKRLINQTKRKFLTRPIKSRKLLEILSLKERKRTYTT